jgi:hypothetical protein
LQKSTRPSPVVSVDAASETQLGRAPPSWLSCLRLLVSLSLTSSSMTHADIVPDEVGIRKFAFHTDQHHPTSPPVGCTNDAFAS